MSPRAGPGQGGGAGEWSEHKTEDGRTYWFNQATKKSSWEKPAEMKAPGEAACPWKEYTTNDGSGKKYYYNAQTKKSVWVMPDELKQIKEAAAMREEMANPDRDEPAFHIPAAAAKVPVAADPAPAAAVAAPAAAAAATVGSAVAGKEAGGAAEKAAVEKPEAGKEEAPAKKPNTYATKDEARAAFTALLVEKKVGGTWSWAQAMSAIITDPRYNSLKTIGEKKNIFNEYASKKSKVEREDNRIARIKSNKEFMELLEEKGDQLSSRTKIREAAALLTDDPRFLAVADERDREDLLSDFTKDLQKKERAAARQKRTADMEVFRAELLSKEWLSWQTQWRRVKADFEEEISFTCLERDDRLQVFQEVLQSLEKVQDGERLKKRKAERRVERKNRDAFRALLGSKRESGEITAHTRWTEFGKKVRTDESYVAMAGQGGSLACELFDDVIEELETDLQRHVDQAAAAIKAAGKGFVPSTTTDELRTWLSSDADVAAWPEQTTQLVHTDLLRTLQRQAMEADRVKVKVGEKFVDLLKDYSRDKDITVDSVWGTEMEALLSSHSVYAKIDVADRSKLFAEFIEKLVQKKKDKDKRKHKKEKKRKHKHRRRHSDSDSDDDRGSSKRRRSSKGGKDDSDSDSDDAPSAEKLADLEIEQAKRDR